MTVQRLTPKVGMVRNSRGQPFRLVAVERRRRVRDDRPYLLCVVEAACATCGAPFTTTVTWSRFAAGLVETRRCPEHRGRGWTQFAISRRKRERLRKLAVVLAPTMGVRTAALAYEILRQDPPTRPRARQPGEPR